MPTTITKPWGFEIILTEPGLSYTLKILNISAGQKLSLQYHDDKTETLSLISGNCQILWGKTLDTVKTETMVKDFGYTIKPKVVHRFMAITDTVLIEASNSETGTTHRLQDDYSRPDETDEVRNSPNRGWKTSTNNN
ncbi:cupin [Candidatus Shapirobacteria bacterium CG10_big_fil_rev_8_21_14_0_10_36_6]|uniref:Cupin n=1 Tax=Candidatus Shapirobacteria bacterium CG10_big_fil_rev_8_21_14_0_10_36_6 TaxID=1974886 RepID=A0A2M8L1K2_9BACT|nr:MAG: cupin [Candidatus Shapirobacteria bacterium CG10_big_fil_rev_8_21_14_0_10_36_6]